jgi:hypothetical protein
MARHIRDKNLEGSVWRLFASGHFITPAVKPGCRRLTEGLKAIGSYTLGYLVSSNAEYSRLLSQTSFTRLSVWNNTGVIELNYQYGIKEV